MNHAYKLYLIIAAVLAILLTMHLFSNVYAGVKVIRECDIFDDFGIYFDNEGDFEKRCMINGKPYSPKDFKKESDKNKTDNQSEKDPDNE